jgi:hypothetical protein
MAWRFRKILQSEPLRWTWTKKGMGWSSSQQYNRLTLSRPNSHLSFGLSK